jgi:calcineurin-like phosphoesterase family protein
MHPIATDRNALLKVVEDTISALQSQDPSPVVAAVAAATVSSPEDVEAQRDAVVNALENSARTLRLHNDLAAMTPRATAGVGPEPPFIPEDQALSLIQSAIEEFRPEETLAAAAPFDTSDPGWLSVAFEKLKALFRGKHKFIEHTSLSSFQLSLPDQATVVLFSDWGTAEETARRVMRQITLQRPTHAIHLGDVYYSGTNKEIQRRFLDVIDAEGPPASGCTYLALNSNHEMYSGGHAYFELTLKTRFGQEASYFNLRNSRWQLIGLDSGYEDHGLKDPQKEWLAAQLAASGLASGPKSILLTHHQLFSPFESRAFDRKLHKKVEPLLGKVFAWFWGHEHKAIIYGRHQGIQARCIGHGAIPEGVPYGSMQFADVPVVKIDERPGPDGENMHGFAVLRFDGDRLHVDYIDELGFTWFQEDLA